MSTQLRWLELRFNTFAYDPMIGPDMSVDMGPVFMRDGTWCGLSDNKPKDKHHEILSSVHSIAPHIATVGSDSLTTSVTSG